SRNKAAGEVLTAKQAPHRPGTAPALGLRAGKDGPFIVPRTNSSEETNHGILDLAAGTNRCGSGGPVQAAEDPEVPEQADAALPAAARSAGRPAAAGGLAPGGPAWAGVAGGGPRAGEPCPPS